MATSQTSPFRSVVIASAIIAIVLGLMALFLPGPSLLTVAILFGIAVIVAGVNRLAVAVRASMLSGGMRIVVGVLGVLVIIAGVVCLVDPLQSLVLLAYLIGFAWIFEGAAGIVGGLGGATGSGRALPIVSGIISVLAGLSMFFLPGLALSAFITVAGIILIVVGIVGLAHLPRRPRRRA